MATSTTTEAHKASQSAQRTADQAKKTTKQAERTAQAIVSDSVYAAVGATDHVLSRLRNLPYKASEIAGEAPKTVKARREQLFGLVDTAETRAKSLVSETPKELRNRVGGLRNGAADEFDELASRGRGVVQSITRNQATRQALDQARTAQSQVKAATTSVRRAFGLSVEAIETAGDKVGQDKGQPAAQAKDTASTSSTSNSAASKSGASKSSASKPSASKPSTSKPSGSAGPSEQSPTT